MRALAEALESVRITRSRLAKEERLASYLRGLDDRTLVHAARVLAGRLFAVDDRRSPRAGGSVWKAAASAATGWDGDTVRDAMRAAGDAGEALGLLVGADPTSRDRPGLTLLEVVALAERLDATGSPARKAALLSDALLRSPPLAAKYTVKVLSGGMRIGAQQGVVEGAIARAFGVPADEVRRAVSRIADLGDVALRARRGELASAGIAVGRPVGFMLATAVQSVAQPPAGEGWIVEDKLDGIRAQVHKQGGDVRLFARSGDPLDGVFPEIEDAVRWGAGSFVLDGEIVALEADGGLAPFAVLQERLNRKAVGTRERARLPVAYVAFDVLADGDDGSLIDRPWSERRARLEALCATRAGETDRIRALPYRALEGTPLETLRREALERGAEGLVVKRSDSLYEAGRRGQSWVKVKEAYGTLDVVITAAEEGHGKRRGLLSDYTFAVWKGGELVNVGKAYSGLTDPEIEALSARLVKLTTAKFARHRVVRPEVVLEVAFDGINRSKRHRSGFALRFPRIARVRDDKAASQANTVDDVAALFNAQGRSRAKITAE